MRIAHLLWSLGTGGVETMIPEIMNEQSKENDVSLFVINDWIVESILAKLNSSIKVYKTMRKESSRNPLPILKLNALLWSFRPDIIYTHSYQLINLVFYPFAKKVRTIHNTYNNEEEYPKYDALISISKSVWQFTKSQGFGSYIADNGISVSNIERNIHDVFADGKTHIIQVSRLCVEQKGQDILLKALSILKDVHKRNDFVMHFVGTGDDEQMLKKMTHDMGLEGNIVFEGLKSQNWVYGNLCNYDLFVQPSRYEGFGLTVAEAIAACLPVLVSDIEGPMEIIENGKYGMHFRAADATDCANKILAFMEKGRDEEQIENALKHVSEKYDVKETAKKYTEIYHTILHS